VCGLGLLYCSDGRVRSYNRDYGQQSLKYSPSGPLQKTLVNPWVSQPVAVISDFTGSEYSHLALHLTPFTKILPKISKISRWQMTLQSVSKPKHLHIIFEAHLLLDSPGQSLGLLPVGPRPLLLHWFCVQASALGAHLLPSSLQIKEAIIAFSVFSLALPPSCRGRNNPPCSHGCPLHPLSLPHAS